MWLEVFTCLFIVIKIDICHIIYSDYELKHMNLIKVFGLYEVIVRAQPIYNFAYMNLSQIYRYRRICRRYEFFFTEHITQIKCFWMV